MFDENGPGRLGKRFVTELAVVGAVATLFPRVEELAGEVLVQVETFVLLGAAVHQIELAQFHLPGRQGGVRVGTVPAAAALALHVEGADRLVLDLGRQRRAVRRVLGRWTSILAILAIVAAPVLSILAIGTRFAVAAPGWWAAGSRSRSSRSIGTSLTPVVAVASCCRRVFRLFVVAEWVRRVAAHVHHLEVGFVEEQVVFDVVLGSPSFALSISKDRFIILN